MVILILNIPTPFICDNPYKCMNNTQEVGVTTSGAQYPTDRMWDALTELFGGCHDVCLPNQYMKYMCTLDQ